MKHSEFDVEEAFMRLRCDFHVARCFFFCRITNILYSSSFFSHNNKEHSTYHVINKMILAPKFLFGVCMYKIISILLICMYAWIWMHIHVCTYYLYVNLNMTWNFVLNFWFSNLIWSMVFFLLALTFLFSLLFSLFCLFSLCENH